jgi:hypothetical protein
MRRHGCSKTKQVHMLIFLIHMYGTTVQKRLVMPAEVSAMSSYKEN